MGTGQRRRNRHNEWQGDKANNRPPVLGASPSPLLAPQDVDSGPFAGRPALPTKLRSPCEQAGCHQGPRPTPQSTAVLAGLNLQGSPGPPVSAGRGPLLMHTHIPIQCISYTAPYTYIHVGPCIQHMCILIHVLIYLHIRRHNHACKYQLCIHTCTATGCTYSNPCTLPHIHTFIHV